MKLTTLEISVLKAIDASEYGEDLRDAVWTFTLTDNMPEGGATPAQLSGVVSSLVQKGCMKTGGKGDEAVVQMTDAGQAAYIEAVGAPNVRKGARS